MAVGVCSASGSLSSVPCDSVLIAPPPFRSTRDGRILPQRRPRAEWAIRMVVGASACQYTPWSGPPGAARASTRRSTAGSSTRGGAWCGLIRASMTSGPRQPQCFRSMNAPMPSMSAAGFDRVNVTQRKFPRLRAANSLSSTTTIRGNASDRIVGADCDAEARRSTGTAVR